MLKKDLRKVSHRRIELTRYELKKQCVRGISIEEAKRTNYDSYH
jgi:hypothetical protein